ncbi:MAG: hypothetical protein ACI39U_08970 [Candidatus Cryptobacteroides sp.]
MKKSLISILSLTALAVAMVSCSEKLISGDVSFSVTADATLSWSGNEKIAVSVNGASPVLFQASKGNTTAFNSTLSDCPASGTIYAVSPFDSEGYGVNDITSGTVAVSIPDSQTSRAGYPDANASILIGSASYSGGLPANLDIKMQTAVAIVKLVVNDAPEKIKSATLTFPANVAGTFALSTDGKTWTEQEASSKITVKSGSGEMYLACAPVSLSSDILVEVTGDVTGAKYEVSVPTGNLVLEAGKVTDINVNIPLSLYIVGSAVGAETAQEAVAMTKNEDGSFSWTGQMAADSEYKIIFDKENLTPAFALGTAFNNIRYSTKATAAPFEIEKAGKYTVTVWPAYGHIQVCRHFDHLLSDAENVAPLSEEFDNCVPEVGVPHDWETRFGPIWQNHGYDTFGLDDSFKLSGPNSYWVNVTWIPSDWTQGRIIRSGDWKQPLAVKDKVYTVMMQMMYEGNASEEVITWKIEGALGTGDGYEETVTLEAGVPVQICKDFTADDTWGGCVNIFIYFTSANIVEDQPFRFYLDAINIGYDD